MVTLTGSLSSPGGGAWLVVVGVALVGDVVRGEDARGKAIVGPVKKKQNQGSASGRQAVQVFR